MTGKPSILFLCTGNSCRSQMAEGLCRALKTDVLEPWSAGLETHGLNPLAVKAMAEIGIDISGYHSKTTNELPEMNYVITVCDHASETCPVFPATTRVIHQGFDDPPRLAADAGDAAAAMVYYRRVRDEIRAFIEQLPGILEQS